MDMTFFMDFGVLGLDLGEVFVSFGVFGLDLGEVLVVNSRVLRLDIGVLDNCTFEILAVAVVEILLFDLGVLHNDVSGILGVNFAREVEAGDCCVFLGVFWPGVECFR